MWKSVLGIGVCAVALACLSVGAQQVQVQVAPEEGGQQVQANKVQSNEPGGRMKATQLIGSMLKDSNGNSIGKVTDIVLDLDNQQIEYLLVHQGENTETFYAVPPTVLRVQPVPNAPAPAVVVRVPAPRFQQAPTFTTRQWTATGFDPVWVQRNDAFYSEFVPAPGSPADRTIDRAERKLNRQLRREGR